MSIVSITEVKVLHNPAAFSDPLYFQIRLNSVQDLQDGAIVLLFKEYWSIGHEVEG
jgi:hypothetical protein